MTEITDEEVRKAFVAWVEWLVEEDAGETMPKSLFYDIRGVWHGFQAGWRKAHESGEGVRK